MRSVIGTAFELGDGNHLDLVEAFLRAVLLGLASTEQEAALKNFSIASVACFPEHASLERSIPRLLPSLIVLV